jgi:hypothetical protein
MDSLGIDETDEDVIADYREMLRNPLLIRSAINVLEEMMENGTLDESDVEEREQCMILVEDLDQLYNETIKTNNRKQMERIER